LIDSEGIHQAIYSIAEHKVIFSEEMQKLLMTTVKQINSNIFVEKFPLFKS